MIHQRYLLDLGRRERLNRAAATVSWFIRGFPWVINSKSAGVMLLSQRMPGQRH